MPQPRSLRSALADSELSGRKLFGIEHSTPLADLLAKTSLDADRLALAGRNVLLATHDQFLTSVALAELDGVAARIVLCPPDLKAEHYPVIIDGAEVDTVVSDLEPQDWFATHTAADRLEQTLRYVRCRWPLTQADTVEAPELRTEWLLMTSGTTGAPKMVQHDLAGLTAAIKPKAPPTQPLVWATFYDMRRYGGLQIYLRGLLGSGSLVLSSAGEPIADHLQRLGRSGVTHISGTPSHWRRALMSPAIEAIDPDYIRLSGEIADQMVLDSLRQAFPRADIGHAYASTEAGVGFEVDDGLEGFPSSFFGRMGAGVEMKIEEGSLRLRSSRAASRYVGSSDLALADPDGFVDTGDMVEIRDRRCFFVGRRNGVINVGGLKVHPEEVETVINRHGAVSMSLVEGRRNPITGAVVVAAVVLKGGETSPADGDAVRSEIMADCRKLLPAHKVPALIRFVPTLAVTPAGKLVRHA